MLNFNMFTYFPVTNLPEQVVKQTNYRTTKYLKKIICGSFEEFYKCPSQPARPVNPWTI